MHTHTKGCLYTYQDDSPGSRLSKKEAGSVYNALDCIMVIKNGGNSTDLHFGHVLMYSLHAREYYTIPSTLLLAASIV